MTNTQIREKINQNNKEISRNFNPSTFILNEKTVALIEENKKLQKICTHKYNEEGFCIYCDKVEELK